MTVKTIDDILTINDVLEMGEDSHVAIMAPGKEPITYETMREKIDEVIGFLHEQGFDKNSRIAVVSGINAERLVAILGVSSSMVAAPIAPKARKTWFVENLEKLKIDAVMYDSELLKDDETKDIVEAANELGLSLIEMTSDPERRAGMFTLEAKNITDTPAHPDQSAPSPDDLSLLMQTTGTTGSGPKTVMHSQRSFSQHAKNGVSGFNLTPEDRCLCPLETSHFGAVGTVMLPVLASGGSGYLATVGRAGFMDHIQDSNPTWIAGITSTHDASMRHLEENGLVEEFQRLLKEHAPDLRFVRTGSMAFPKKVLNDMQYVYGDGVLIVQNYGLTEAANGHTSIDPKRPRLSVGEITRPGEIEIMLVDPENRNKKVPLGQEGEIAIAGPHVCMGYEDNDEANAESFFEKDGKRWILSGDIGVFRDGELYIVGRTKEMINRGGTKIPPQAVDDALIGHPYVAQAATFAIPQSGVVGPNRLVLGETVGSLVILTEEAAQEPESAIATIRKDITETLHHDFMPDSIIVGTEQDIPLVGPGKVNRVALSGRVRDVYGDIQDLHQFEAERAAEDREQAYEERKTYSGVEAVGAYYFPDCGLASLALAYGR